MTHGADCHFCQLGYAIDERDGKHHINPETKVWPIAEWGSECARGFVGNERFARPGDRVIKPTPRYRSKKWRTVAKRIRDSARARSAQPTGSDTPSIPLIAESG